MTARHVTRTIVAIALLALTLAPGLVAAEPRFETNRSTRDVAQYQIVKHERIFIWPSNVVLDTAMIEFLEANIDNQPLQLTTPDTITAHTAPCQGEGLVNDTAVRAGVAGTVAAYCSGEAFAESLGSQDDLTPQTYFPTSAWPIGYFDY